MAQINDSMGEGLKKLLGQIAQLMTTPDADMQFLSGLQQVVVNQLGGIAAQAAQSQAQQAMQTIGSPGTTPSGAVPSMGLGPVPAGQTAPGGGQAPPGPSAPNPDELRRILANG